jgi:uncharacterized protein (DUF885 family)
MKRITQVVWICLITLWAGSISPPVMAQAQDLNRRLAGIAQQYFDQKLLLDPMGAHATLAEARFESGLAILIAPGEIRKATRLAERVLQQLRDIDPSRLTKADLLTYQMLRDEAQMTLDGNAFPGHLMPIDSFGGVPLAVAGLGSGTQFQTFKTPTQYDNYLKRLRRLPAWNTQAIANMREGIRLGYVVPKSLIETALASLKPLANEDFAKSTFSSALKIMPTSFSESDRVRINKQYERAFTTEILPSMRKLVAFLEKEYLPKCRDTAGLSFLPSGEAYYRYMVKYHTTTSMSPDEIHLIGLREVERIRGEMAKVQSHYQFKGTLTDFLKWQSQDLQFRPFKTEEEILTAYADLNKKVAIHLPKMFGRAPKAVLRIRAVPLLQRAAGGNYYQPASPDGQRPGTFFAWWDDPTKFSNTIMTTLFLHEGQPGHHYQNGIQQELSLPAFRRFGWSTAFGEGWALYAETLGHEMGLYDDPNQYLGHLKLELLRAVRLVTDTGLHAKGWTREQTIQYMIETEGASEAAARNATERYMALPGQALAYKIGSMHIQALRGKAQMQLGARFKLSDFHDLVLSEGVVPLSTLTSMVDQWVVSQAAP